MAKEFSKIMVGLAVTRGGSRAAEISEIECFVIIVNGWKPLTIITKHSILDISAALDPPLITVGGLVGLRSFRGYSAYY